MAFSDNLTSVETWAFRPSLENSWFSDAFARDTEILTKALQQSIASGVVVSSATLDVSPYSDLANAVNPETPSSQQQGQSLSTSGGFSDPETVSKRCKTQNHVLPPKGKVGKRRSRASKGSPTTFITANPENFRQMVQQVTGVRFSPGQFQIGSVVKPEPQRIVNRLQAGCLLPTLDTSAFLLDHHHQQVAAPASEAVTEAAGVGGGGAGFDYDGFSNCFPTLESWKVR